MCQQGSTNYPIDYYYNFTVFMARKKERKMDGERERERFFNMSHMNVRVEFKTEVVRCLCLEGKVSSSLDKCPLLFSLL